MPNLRTVLTHLCEALLVEFQDTQLCHITFNIPLKAITGYYRVGCDGAFSITTFCITPQHCMGSILQEPDGAYWTAPHLTVWSTFSEYLGEGPLPVPLSWRALLELFATVEIIQANLVTQWPTCQFLSAPELVELVQLEELLLGLDCSTSL